MTAAIATVIVAVVAALASIIAAVINVMFARGGQRADEASKLTSTGMNLLTEVKANCDACTKELVQIKKAVRAIVRSLDSDDPHALAAAIDAARDLV